MSPARNRLIEWLKQVEVRGNTLDIGGKVWSMRGQVKSFEGQYTSIDENTIDLNQAISMGNYDNIFCTEVMQFVYDPVKAMKSLHMSIETGGKLYISFHLVHPPMKDHDYMRYTEKGVRKLIDVSRFKIENFQEPLKGYYLVTCSAL